MLSLYIHVTILNISGLKNIPFKPPTEWIKIKSNVSFKGYILTIGTQKVEDKKIKVSYSI